MIRECSTCYFYTNLNSKKGFCYKNRNLPEPKKKSDSCMGWSQDEREAGLFEI